MNIGDLYYAFRGDGARLMADAKKEGEKAGTVAGKSFGAKFSGAFKGGKGGLLSALGIGAGIGVATAGVAKLADVMGDAVEAAIAEEESIARLDAALRANIATYNGNTDAIEETLKARMRLGFADDEQRESLALAIAATEDETKALELQRTAMDLARLKKISLADATQALIKVEGGQFRILKSLGIQLPKNATATEALAAVQKVANGQAEAFAKTSRGKLLASQIKVGEALEKLGAVILPAVVKGIEGASDAVTSFMGALDGVGTSAANNQDPMQNLANLLSDLFKDPDEDAKTFFGAIFDGLNDVIGATENYVRAQREAEETNRETNRGLEATKAVAADAADALDDTGGAWDDMGGAAGDAADDMELSISRMKDGLRDLVAAHTSAARDIIGDYYDPIEQRNELTALQREASELRQIIASKNSTDEQIADARRRLFEIERATVELLMTLAAQGKATVKELNAATASWSRKWRAEGAVVGSAIWRILRQLQLLKLAALEASGALKFGGLANSGRGAAHGGPAPAGVPIWTGELGRELIVPMVDSYVIPHTQSMNIASGNGGGGDTIIPLTITGLPMQAESPADIVREVRRASRLGLAPRRRPRAFSRS